MKMKKNPKIALILSILFPGLGHLYLGQYLDSVVLICSTGFLWYAMLAKTSMALKFDSPRAYIFWLGFVAVYLIAAISAYKSAKANQ